MRQMRFFQAAAGLCAVMGSVAEAGDEIDFNRDIRPILSSRCFQCHGPDEEARQADLRLDVANDPAGPFADRGDAPVIRPRDPAASSLWQRINTLEADEVMPPPEAHQPPLSATEKGLLKRWIEEGAEYLEFWAFTPPGSLDKLPSVHNRSWSGQRIDQFVMARLEKEGLAPQSRADKRTLIRRVTFDLTGLPPTRAEIAKFLADDAPTAYEDLVDRLLASPSYGEHMAKYWLDLVRFADTNGIHHDHFRELTPYRDWVIRAFNDNLPFDKFLTYQLAGDLYENPSLDQQIASGFNRLHLVIDAGTALPEESFHRNVVDRVTAFGTAVLGLTVQCGECHDHKYDPITQRDFYQLYAFFNNIDAGPETPGQGIHPPYIDLPTDEERRQLEDLDLQIAAVGQQIEALKQSIAAAESPTSGDDPPQTSEPSSDSQSAESPTEASDENPDAGDETTEDPAAAQLAAKKSELETAENQLETLIEQRKAVKGRIVTTLVMKERAEVRPTHIRVRGVYDQLGEQVERDTPAFLPALAATGDVKSRMDLANWVTDAGNPLTARVAVNRFWQQLFGVGLVKTSEDFGTQSDWPSHRALLDDLSRRFMESGWDVKQLMKSIVMTETYAQSSHADPALFRADPENRLLARGSRFRMDSEMIRDQILAVSGLLVREMYGRSVKPPQPPNLWKTVSMVSSSTYSFEADVGDKIHRRSIYSFWKRAMPPPQMTIFDAPTRERCIARRERTNTPLQALVLMNEGQYFKAARNFARQLLDDVELTDQQRITTAYEAITSQLPDEVELSTLRSGLENLRNWYQAHPSMAAELTSEEDLANDAERAELAAHTMLINSLLNLDVTKTRE